LGSGAKVGEGADDRTNLTKGKMENNGNKTGTLRTKKKATLQTNPRQLLKKKKNPGKKTEQKNPLKKSTKGNKLLEQETRKGRDTQKGKGGYQRRSPPRINGTHLKGRKRLQKGKKQKPEKKTSGHIKRLPQPKKTGGKDKKIGERGVWGGRAKGVGGIGLGGFSRGKCGIYIVDLKGWNSNVGNLGKKKFGMVTGYKEGGGRLRL